MTIPSSLMIDNNVSLSTLLPLGGRAPQGSILGPLFFSRYTLTLGANLRNNSFSSILMPMQPLLDSFKDVKEWLNTDFLHLNDSKTEAVIFVSNGKGDVSPLDL